MSLLSLPVELTHAIGKYIDVGPLRLVCREMRRRFSIEYYTKSQIPIAHPIAEIFETPQFIDRIFQKLTEGHIDCALFLFNRLDANYKEKKLTAFQVLFEYPQEQLLPFFQHTGPTSTKLNFTSPFFFPHADKIASYLAYCTELTSLTITNTLCVDTVLERCRTIKTLTISCTSNVLPNLSKMKHLEELIITESNGCKLARKGILDCIKSCAQLKKVSIPNRFHSSP